MRFLCFLFLIAFAGAVGIFAWQNQQEITLQFFEWTTTASVAAAVGVAYGLGMLSGWSVVGIVRRSFRRVTEERHQRAPGTLS
jgi:uncharacterized integral membrane protein